MHSLILKKKLDGISKCSTNGHKVKNLFQILTNNLELWDLAHQEIASNKGATTRGVDDVTADGHSDERVISLMDLLKTGKHKFQPVRRTYIPKANGKKRPLGIPNYHDKLVQSACKILLEAIYEPTFHPQSWGFRPRRSCLDALETIGSYNWNGTKWFIEFDIKGYFDNINHDKLMEILSEKIDDKRFLALIRKMLRAGYMEDWKYNKTYSGTPQGGVISPILANIYLDKLDWYIDEKCQHHSFGKDRRTNPKYNSIRVAMNKVKKLIQDHDASPDPLDEKKRAWREGRIQKYKDYQHKLLNTRSKDDFDESFRRLRYCRYADDFVLGYIGSKEEALGIMDEIKSFLQRELHLEVSEDKTKVESSKDGIRFLGYDLRRSENAYVRKTIVTGAPSYKRSVDSLIRLHIPEDKLKGYCKSRSYGSYLEPKKSKHRSYLLNLSDAEIISKYNSELRGFFQYYKLAYNYSGALWKLHYVADYSCRKTLANKHKSTVKKISKKYVERTERGDKKLTVKVERNGRKYSLVKPNDIDRNFIPHVRRSMEDVVPDYDTITHYFTGHNDLTKRRKKEICESCGVKTAFVEEHHVRALKDIQKSTKWWDKQMIARNRKTLILCISCHDQLHAGTLPDMRKLKAKKAEHLTGVEQ